MSTTVAPLEERGVSCSLDNYLVLPDNTMDARIAAARRELGSRAVILGHHYQRDEVIRFADLRGDSYKLAQEAARTKAEYIVFCGVHFMAESADILGHAGQQVILPDLAAGWCARHRMRPRPSSGRLSATKRSSSCLTSTWDAIPRSAWEFRWTSAWS